MVVDDRDAQRPARPGMTAGSVTWTRVPRGRRLDTETVPPNSAARSRIAVQPTPVGSWPSMPTPSSTTSMATSGPIAIVNQHRDAWAWRTTFVSASVAMR